MSQPPQKNRTKPLLARQPSENSLEDFIPSFPGTPRELSIIDVFFKGKTEGETQREIRDIENETAQYQRDVLLKEQDFLIAAEAGDAERLQQLIKAGVNVHQTDLFGRNALHLAVYSANEDAILVALRAGIKATVKDDIGMTPLSICLMRSPKASIAKLLFKYGAKILPRGSPMDTGIFIQFVMMCTPTEEEKEIFQLLIENGAVVNDPRAPGQRQALHFAAMSNNCELIRILADLGANPFALNHRHETPRDVAVIFKCKEAVECLTEIETQIMNAPIVTEQADEEVTTKIYEEEDITDNLSERIIVHKKSVQITDSTQVSPSYNDTGDMNKVNSDTNYDKNELTREMGRDSFIEAEQVNNQARTSESKKSTNDSNSTIKPANHDETEKPHKRDANAREKHSKREDHSNNRR